MASVRQCRYREDMITEPGIPDAFESNAGDDFHLQWAARKALSMLHPRSTLKGIGLDQVHPDDVGRMDQGGDSLLGIDLAEYYGGDSFAFAEQVVHTQLKYSTRRAYQNWTAALLSPTGKAAKKCIIRRLTDVYAHYVKQFGREETLKKLRIKLVSNRPCDTRLVHAIDAARQYLSSKMASINAAQLLKAVSKAQAKQISYLRRSVELKSTEFTDFLRVFDVSECGAPSRLAMDTALVGELGELGFYEARTQYSLIMNSIRRRMQPENRGDKPYTESDVMVALEVPLIGGLYPAPTSFEDLEDPIPRNVMDDLAMQAVEHVDGLVCVHGAAGAGKTTLIRQLCSAIPSGSVPILFDCYGGGSYLNHDSKRHGYRRAVLQIANELAGKAGTPLLINQDLRDEDYTRELQRRLDAAARVIRKANPDALVLLIVDAADNSLTAADRWKEESFVSGLTKMKIPDGCRLILTARTHRVDLLELPAKTLHFEVPCFTIEESRQHVEKYCGPVVIAGVLAFNELTHGLPRTQAYALSQCGRDLSQALDLLRPGGKTLDHLIDSWLDEAGRRLGDERIAEKICPALLTLARPVPSVWASKLSGVDEATLVSFCQDAGLGFSVHGSTIGFKDEDFETRIGQRYSVDEHRYGALADALLDAQLTDGYAAAHVADALRAANRTQDIVRLVHDDGQPKSITDPVERTEAFARRAQLAMEWVLEQGDNVELLRLLCILAESGKADQAVEDLLLNEGDLAVRYGNVATVHRLYINKQNTRLDWQGPMHLRCSAHFSRWSESHVQAREHLSHAEAWIREFFSRPPEDRHHWDLTAEDIAHGAEAVFRLSGVDAAFRWIARWRPRSFRFEMCKKLADAVFVSDATSELELVWEPMPRYEDVLAIVDGAMQAGRIPPESFIRHVVRQWARKARAGHRVNARLCGPGVSLCEAAAHHGVAPCTIRSLLKMFMPVSPSRTYSSSIEELSDSFGCQLRAIALRAALTDRNVDLADESLYPPEPDAGDSDRARAEHRRWEEDRKELEKNYRYAAPAYLFRAQALIQGTSLTDSEEMFSASLGAGGHDWEWESKQYEQQHMVRLRARVLTDGVILAFDDPVPSFTQLHEHLMRSNPAWMAKDLAERAVRVSDLSDLVMTIVSGYVDTVQQAPSPASEQVDALVWASRISGQVDVEIGRMYFEQAVEAAGEIDSECAAMLQLFAQITDRATSGCRAAHDDLALRLAQIIEDCYWRWKEGGREYPWNESLDALSQLSPRTACAALGRWDQRGILQWVEEAARLARGLVGQGSIDWRTAISVAAHSPITHSGALAFGLSVLGNATQPDADVEPASVDQALVMLADRASRLVAVGQRKQSIDDLLQWADDHGYRDHPAVADARSYRDGIVALQPGDGDRNDYRGAHLDDADGDAEKKADAEELWVALVQRCDPCDADAITSVIEEAYATAQERNMPWQYLKALPANVLRSIRKEVDVGDRPKHLEALVRATTSKVSHTDLIDILVTVRGEWSNTPTVRRWFAQLPTALAEHRFHDFFYREFFAWNLLTEIEDALGISRDVMSLALLKAVPPHIRDLSPDAIYDLSRPVASRLNQPQALNLLLWVVHRSEEKSEGSTLACRSINVDQVASDGAGLVAAVLWFLMGHPDKRIRWQALHMARGAVLLGDNELLGELAKWLDRGQDHPFCAPGTTFYWLSARVWLLILIDWMSEEKPAAVVSMAAVLKAEAVDPSTPHVMTMHLARNAALRLVEFDSTLYDADTLLAIQNSLHSGPPADDAADEDGDSSAYHSNDYRHARSSRFDFDMMDTLPYWYAPAGRVFGIDGSKFCDDAGKVIADEWRVRAVPHRDDPVHKWKVPGYRWQLCSNGHGTEPVIEDLRHYLEFHAMMCVMARYAQSLPVRPDRWDDGSPWDRWLHEWGLSSGSKWLADQRERTPLESALWTWSDRFDEEWLHKVDDRLFDQAVGLVEPGMEGHLVIDGDVNRYQYGNHESIRILSALVPPETSESLLGALCQCHTHDYRIPPEGDDLEIDEKLSDGTAFMLRGWLRQDYGDFNALDRHDPFRFGFKNSGCTPGTAIRKWIELQPHDMTVYQAWNDCPKPEDDHSKYTTGNRLWIRRDGLQEFLASIPADLIVECDVNRYLGSRSYSRTKDTYATQTKLYLVKTDGTIIGRRSDPEPRPETRT